MNEILQKRNQVELNLGLENLLIQFKNNDFDLLRGYFEQHSSLEALFYLLQQEQQQQQQTLELVLKVLVNILRNTKQLGYKSLGTLICRRITREFLPLCYRELNSGKPSFIAPTLELLAGIAIYTTSTCRELAKCFNFNLKSLCSLFKVRKQNIRQLNARFLLSFLVKGDFHVRQNFLGVKNLLQKLFLELHTDNVEFVDYVLGVLEKRVVVEAELKLSRLLHIGVLENLLLLYKQVSITINEGPVVDDVLAQEITRKMMLSDRVDRFFRTLCTVQGQGLLAEKESNSTMLKFMLALKVTNDFKQRQLLLDVMRLQPDLIHQYFAKTTLSFEPRSTVNYLSNIALVTTIIAFPCKFDPSSTIPAAKAVINGIIPPAITKQIVSKGISSGVVDVYFAASVQLQTSFKKLQQVVGEIESVIMEIECDPHLHANTCQEMVNGWQTLKENILSEFKQKLPDSQVIIKHLKSNLVEIDDNNVTSEDVFVIMTQLLQNYAVFAPEQFQDHSYDFSKAIPVHVDCMGDDAIKSLLELLKVVKEFKWWTKHSNYRTCFGVLFDLYLARSDQHLKILIEDNLSLFFEDTFMFQGYKEAIKLLWKVACRFSHNGNVGRVLEEVLFAGYHESKKLFEETVNLYKSGIEEVENPVNIGLFPPVFLVLLRRAFKSEDVTVHLLCSSYIMETVQAFCIWEGLPYILKVLDKYLDVSEAEKNGCLMGLSNWMKSVSGLPIVFPTLEMIRWNQGL